MSNSRHLLKKGFSIHQLELQCHFDRISLSDLWEGYDVYFRIGNIMLRWVFEAIKFSDRLQGTYKLIREHFSHIHELVDGSGCSLLHTAANHRNTEAIEFIFTLYEQRTATDPEFNWQRKRDWVNQRDSKGFTALHYAVFRQELQAVQLLERNGADIYLCSGDGLNCLHLAAQGGSPLLMYYFMGKGMKIGGTDSGGSTCLHWACYSGAQNAVSALLAWGAELDSQEIMHGATPLHLAVIAGSERIVKWLLLAGCDRSLVNKKGQTPRDLALQKKQERMAQIIEDKFSILTLLNLKSRYRPTSRRAFPFCFLVSMFVISFIANVAYILPPQNAIVDVTVIISFIVGIFLAFFFVFLGVSDPGVLPQQGQENLMNILCRSEPGRICFRCNIIRPIRSRHCTTCGCCISVYDHHCPWIGNCIGCGNYMRFFAFLVMLEIYLLYNIAYHIRNLIFPHQVSNAVLNVQILASVINLIMGALFAPPLMVLIGINARNASSNRTSFEELTKANGNSQKMKSKAMTIESQLTDSMSTASKKTKTIQLLEQEKEKVAVDVWPNCWAMCIGNSRVPEYHHA